MSGECSEFDKLKAELIGLGLYEDGMNEDDVMDLMAAIRNSQDSALKEERLRESNKKVQSSRSTDPVVREVKRGMERRYKNVPERRMPWNLFPFPEQLSLEQKARILAVYKQQLTLCQYRKAKSSSVFAEWTCVYKLPLKAPTEYKSVSIHHTRSGRTVKSTPHYVDDDSDTESVSVSRKPRKKMRKLTNEEIISRSSLFKDNVSNVDSNVDNDKTAHKSVINESSRSSEEAKCSTTPDEEKKTNVSPSYVSSSPEFVNEDIIVTEEIKETSRKRARVQKDINVD